MNPFLYWPIMVLFWALIARVMTRNIQRGLLIWERQRILDRRRELLWMFGDWTDQQQREYEDLGRAFCATEARAKKLHGLLW